MGRQKFKGEKFLKASRKKLKLFGRRGTNLRLEIVKAREIRILYGS